MSTRSLEPNEHQRNDEMDVDKRENPKEDETLLFGLQRDDEQQKLEQQRCFQDFIETQELKFRFSGAPFHRYWRFMKKIGWTFNASKPCYHAPPGTATTSTSPCTTSDNNGDGKDEKEEKEQEGKSFEKSNAIFAFLDQYAIPEVFSNLQSGPSHSFENWNLADQRLARRLRRDILTEVYRCRTAAGASSSLTVVEEPETPLTGNEPQKTVAESSDGEDQEDVDAPPPSSTRRSTRSTNNSAATSTRNNASLEASATTVTALEKGTDLYLHRNSRGRASKKKASFNLSNDMDDDDNDDDSNNHNKPLYQPTMEECAKLVENYPIDKVEAMEAAYEAEFEHWRFLLSTNHSLLLHGAGSKRQLLQNFARLELRKEGYALLIDGFDPDVSISGILNLLVDLFLNKQEPCGLSAIPRDNGPDVPVIGRSTLWRAHAIVERAIAIGRALALAVSQVHVPQDDSKPIFLVIHNLEGERLRNTLAQDALAALAVNSTVANGVAVVRIVASVDHVNAPTLLWNSNVATAANFAWMHLQVHTHRPYTVELTTNMLIETTDVQRRTRETMRQKKESVQNARVLDVLRNLAPRHAEVVQILARLQLKQQEGKKNGGGGPGSAAAGWVAFREFSKSCQTACAVNKDSQLHLFVDELRDHGLISTKDSSEFVRIPYQEAKLREILAFKVKSSG